VKISAKKAAAAGVLKRQQLKEAKEREAGNKEPSIDTDTRDEAQNNVEESVSSEEPVEEPGQKLEPEREPVLDQGPADEEEPIAEKEKETANEEPSGWNAWLLIRMVRRRQQKIKRKMLILKLVPRHLKIGEE
jgi:hypothetical protein